MIFPVTIFWRICVLGITTTNPARSMACRQTEPPMLPLRKALRLPARRWIKDLLAVCALIAASGPAGAAGAGSRTFNVPADVAARSLKAFSRQAGVEVLIPSTLSRIVKTNAVRGEMTPREALARMLAGTQLEAVEDAGTGALAIRRRVPKHARVPEDRKSATLPLSPQSVLREAYTSPARIAVTSTRRPSLGKTGMSVRSMQLMPINVR